MSLRSASSSSANWRERDHAVKSSRAISRAFTLASYHSVAGRVKKRFAQVEQKVTGRQVGQGLPEDGKKSRKVRLERGFVVLAAL